jgi:hypothetical protein
MNMKTFLLSFRKIPALSILIASTAAGPPVKKRIPAREEPLKHTRVNITPA